MKIELENVNEIRDEGVKKFIVVDTDKSNVADIIAEIGNKANILDVEIKGDSIDHVIKKIYSGQDISAIKEI